MTQEYNTGAAEITGDSNTVFVIQLYKIDACPVMNAQTQMAVGAIPHLNLKKGCLP